MGSDLVEALSKAEFIKARKRLGLDVSVGVRAPGQPNRVAFEIAADPRIVVAEIVLRKPGLGVVVLARESEIVGIYFLAGMLRMTC